MPEVQGGLKFCANGYHLAREQDLLRWLNASIYEAEPSEEMIEGDGKVVCRSVRLLRKTPWSQQTAVLFACDCAERVLPIYEKSYPNDQRPRQAIETARKWVHGKATLEEVQAAAYAAHAAAYAAADAARAAHAAADAAENTISAMAGRDNWPAADNTRSPHRSIKAACKSLPGSYKR